MDMVITYCIIAIILLAAELVYFRIADKYNIIDKPNQRSSHTRIVLRGGGIIFTIALWIWSIWYGFQYPWLLVGVTLAAGVSFVDDIHSLPDSLRLVVQFASMFLVFQEVGLLSVEDGGSWLIQGLIVLAALIVCVGATNIYNFMDGINGITAGYALAVLLPLLLLNGKLSFINDSYLIIAIIGVLVFCIFNFRPKGKAKCFAGDVGSIGIAFIMLFAIGKLIVQTGDITYLILLLVYGVDGCLTIIHRIMLHENLGQAHRKHITRFYNLVSQYSAGSLDLFNRCYCTSCCLLCAVYEEIFSFACGISCFAGEVIIRYHNITQISRIKNEDNTRTA